VQGCRVHSACCNVAGPVSRQVLAAANRPGPSLPPPRAWAQFGIGWTFHRGAYRALRRGRANMDVLISVGTNAGGWAGQDTAGMGKLLLQPVLQLLKFCLLASNAPPPSLLRHFPNFPLSRHVLCLPSSPYHLQHMCTA
jgi:hypothetical protein